MSDYINKVKKIVYDASTVIFILQTEGDPDYCNDNYWYWQVDKEDIRNYFRTHSTGSGLVIAINGQITPTAAEIFANDIDNCFTGTSVSDFETLEDALQDIGI